MITSASSLFKALTVVALSLLAAVSEKPAAAPAVERSGFVSEMAVGVTGPCVVDAQTLCLNGGRFKVQVTWRVPSQGTSGVGTAAALTGDTGYFWFFSSNNIELVLKVVDGRGFNGKFWVFYGALSDVEYSIAVTDTATGTVRTYSNPSGSLASVADTAAFDGGSIGATGGSEESKVEGPTSNGDDPGLNPGSNPGPLMLESRTSASAACVAGDSTLCLNGGRFKVEVGWRVPSQGTSGSGRAVTLTGDTGQFWFFSANNIELVIKVVDGRGFNGKFWVFYGALSDVEYTIQVTDTATGNSKTFVNPSGHLASVADTSGFDTAATPTPTATPTVPASTATPVPTPTRTPTQAGSATRIVNVGVGGATAFVDAVSGNSSTTIHVGDTVTWVFPRLQDFHSSTSGGCMGGGGYYDDGGCTPDGNWDSGQLYAGQMFSKTFTTAGSYRYYCSVHGAMMTGSVQVNP